MWNAAVKIWYHHPIIGSGIGDLRWDYIKILKDGGTGFADVYLYPYSYAHSNIFDALAGTGILGLIGMIVATFILPGIFFLKTLKSSVNDHDKYSVVFGTVFVAAFMVFGLTENWLAHSQHVMAYSLLLAIMESRFGSEPK